MPRLMCLSASEQLGTRQTQRDEHKRAKSADVHVVGVSFAVVPEAAVA
jgi:hypothetical protein